MFVTLLPSLEWARHGKQREVYQLRGAFLLFPTILRPGTGWIESASDDFCLVMWQKNDALVKQEIWEDAEPGVPRLPSTFYPYQVSAENHIILPNKLPFLPSTEKAGHFNLYFHNERYHLTSPHLTSPHLTSPRLASPRLASPRLASPHLTSPHLTSPHLASPHLTSPHILCYGIIVKYPWIFLNPWCYKNQSMWLKLLIHRQRRKTRKRAGQCNLLF